MMFDMLCVCFCDIFSSAGGVVVAVYGTGRVHVFHVDNDSIKDAIGDLQVAVQLQATKLQGTIGVFKERCKQLRGDREENSAP